MPRCREESCRPACRLPPALRSETRPRPPQQRKTAGAEWSSGLGLSIWRYHRRAIGSGLGNTPGPPICSAASPRALRSRGPLRVRARRPPREQRPLPCPGPGVSGSGGRGAAGGSKGNARTRHHLLAFWRFMAGSGPFGGRFRLYKHRSWRFRPHFEALAEIHMK